MYVDVAQALNTIAAPSARAIRSAKSTTMAETRALPPPSANVTEPVKPTLGDAQLEDCFERRRGVAYVARLEALEGEQWPGFAAALHAPFTTGVLTATSGSDFVIDVARNFLRRLELSADQWLGVVIAACVAENNAVLDYAVARAAGASERSTARAYVVAWRADGRASTADFLERALQRVG